MIITVNSEKIEVKDNSSIKCLLSKLKLPEKGIAIAIDKNIIPTDMWNNYILESGHDVLIIKATQGG